MAAVNRRFIFISVAAFAAVLTGLFKMSPLYINVTSSLPYGIYVKAEAKDIHKGDIILFCLEGSYASLASDRGYLTQGRCSYSLSPIGKKVVALKGDHISVDASGIRVNQILLKNTAPALHDAQGRPLYFANISMTLKDSEYMTASEKKNSFDSRYFGPVRRSDILGRLYPLLTFNSDHE